MKTREICNKRGHLAVVCRQKSTFDNSSKADSVDEAVKARGTKTLWPEGKPKLSFAKGPKTEKAKENVEGMVASEMKKPSERVD